MAIAGKLQTLQLKIESSYGGGATFATSDVVRFKNFKHDQKKKFLKNDAVMPHFSRLPDEVGDVWTEASFETLFHGSGTAATAAKIGCLLISAGMTETPTTSVAYTLNSSATVASVALSGVDGVLVKSCKGGVVEQLEIGWKAGELVIPKWTVKGIWTAVTDGSMIAPVFESAGANPLIAKGYTFAVHSYSALIRSFSLVVKNELAPIYLPSAANSISGWQIMGREITGSFVCNAVPVATHDFYGRAKAKTTGALNIVLGSAAGNTWTIAAPALQYLDITESDEEGVRCFNVPFQLCLSAAATGNDELTLTSS